MDVLGHCSPKACWAFPCLACVQCAVSFQHDLWLLECCAASEEQACLFQLNRDSKNSKRCFVTESVHLYQQMKCCLFSKTLLEVFKLDGQMQVLFLHESLSKWALLPDGLWLPLQVMRSRWDWLLLVAVPVYSTHNCIGYVHADNLSNLYSPLFHLESVEGVK